MKYAMAVLAGIFLGAAVAAALLYVNPLTGGRGAAADGFDHVFGYDSALGDVLVVAHAGKAPLPVKPVTVPVPWESTVRSVAVAVTVLSDRGAAAARAPAAVATRVTLPSKHSDLLTRGLLVDDYWLVTVPGEGAFFVTAQSNVWPALKENVLPVALLGRSWTGPRSYHATEGPGADGTALLEGASGRFAGRLGRVVERIDVKSFNRRGGFAELAGELHWQLLEE